MQSKLVATSKIIELQEEKMNKMQSQIEKLIKGKKFIGITYFKLIYYTCINLFPQIFMFMISIIERV